VKLFDVALLYRLCCCGEWLAMLVGRVLAAAMPRRSCGWIIRIVDATTAPRPRLPAKRGNGLWCVHAAFDLPAERFGTFALSDEGAGEQLDRITVIPGECASRIAPICNRSASPRGG
jgi:hypothetical protein